jgi:hypothetical protein
MKLLIVGSPKTGNVWLERLLSKIYELPIVDLSGTREWELPPLTQSSFITHQHYWPKAELLAWGERERVQFFALIRHPGDIFVSLYHYVNRFAPFWQEKGWIGRNGSHVMIGEEIDSPIVLEYLRRNFKRDLHKSLAWLQSGKALIVRYEDLKISPLEALKQLTDRLKPVDTSVIEQAIEATARKQVHAFTLSQGSNRELAGRTR